MYTMSISKNSIQISLVFSNGKKYNMKIVKDCPIREQIKDFLLNNTEERGKYYSRWL